MPEGCSIHRLKERYAKMEGRVVSVASPQGRFSHEAKILNGKRLLKAFAKGKHLFLEFDDERFVHIHLGLYGRVRWTTPPEVSDSPSVRMRLTDGSSFNADLIGANTCEVVSKARVDEICSKLGPDPLDPDSSIVESFTRLKKSTKPIARVLMDQSLVSGIGNVYRCELLWRHRLDPFAVAGEISEDLWVAIFNDARELMEGAVRRGRMMTRDSARRGEGGDSFNVYKRTGESCERCGGKIVCCDVSGRTLYYCEGCQTQP